jgi:DNA-binding response OmpR family regulator
MLSAFLDHAGLEVSVCATWEEAIACADDQRPDVMLLDLWMPTFEPALLRTVRQTSPGSGIVVVSALPVEESKRQIAGIGGIARVVSKRDHPAAIVSAVWQALRSAGRTTVVR